MHLGQFDGSINLNIFHRTLLLGVLGMIASLNLETYNMRVFDMRNLTADGAFVDALHSCRERPSFVECGLVYNVTDTLYILYFANMIE